GTGATKGTRPKEPGAAGAFAAGERGEVVHAGALAGAAVEGVVRRVDLAAVRGLAVAVGEAGRALPAAGAGGAERDGVGRGRAGVHARAAMLGRRVEVDAFARAVGQIRRARGPGVRLAGVHGAAIRLPRVLIAERPAVQARDDGAATRE